VLVGAGICCVIVEYVVEWGQSRGALVWHGRIEGFVVLLLSVGDAWMQDGVQTILCVIGQAGRWALMYALVEERIGHWNIVNK
jgi:hypothetical protein